MKVSSSISPLAFTLETNPRRPNFQLTRFHENAIATENGWDYDEYCLELPASDTLEADVETHYDEYLRRAMESESASTEEFTQAARNAALRRIEGKCSAAIYAGVTVNGKHYTLSEHEQAALSIAQSKVDKGATAVLYGDGLKDAATITAISAAAYEWGVVCTTYYAYLKSYIAAETATDKLAAIHFGSSLPTAYMTPLTKLLASAGIDISKYASTLSA